MNIVPQKKTLQGLGILFCLLFYNPWVYAQITAIPDANFEQALVTLNIDSDGLVNGQLLNSDAVGVQTLNVSASNIADLTGIAAFTNLNVLIANDNQLTTVDLSSNVLLRSVDMTYNQLTSFNVLSNTILQNFDVSNNLLTTIDLPNTTTLTNIKFQFNDLTSIDLSNLTALEYLYCQRNQLASLDLSNNSALKYLDCAHNLFTSLDVSNKVDLYGISCPYNTLTSLVVVNNPALVYLYCFDNQLTSLDVLNAPLLEALRCSENQLTQLSFPSSTLLSILDASENQLSSLNLLHCTLMRTLDLNDNVLSTLDLTTQASLNTLNVENNQLTTLDLSGNPLLWSFTGNNNNLIGLDLTNNTNLRTIYCGNNQLTSIVAPNNTNLSYLQCNDNQLTTLNILNSPNLSGISCGNNQLMQLEMPNSAALTGIYANGNQLTTFNGANHPILTSLAVSDNLFRSIDVSDNPLLEDFLIENNLLTALDVSQNPLLTRLVCSNNNISGMLDVTRNPNLHTLYCHFNQLLRLQLANTNINLMYAHSNLYGLAICVPDTAAALAKPTFGQIAWVKAPDARYVSDNCYIMAVRGRVAIDSIVDCIPDSTERGLINQLVRFERGADVFYSTTYNANGEYLTHLDTGTYVVSLVPRSAYWQACPISQTIVVDTNSLVQNLDWAMEPILSCSELQVDISAPFLRIVGGGNYYTVSYCNYGTIAAAATYVEIDLDPALRVLSSSLPILNQVGNLYTFNVGNLESMQCGNFRIYVELDSMAHFGQTHCTEAHIYPDTVCLPNIWVHSRLAVDAQCQNDTVTFTINNYGAAMGQPSRYYVFEDNIMMRQSTFQIGLGGAQQVLQAADPGKTYRIIAKQEMGYPPLLGDSLITAATEGCNPFLNGSFNTGFITQFSNGNSAPFIAVDCQQNIASYDPNDKKAQPAGYDITNHYIYDYTALEYKIRFQNTGTDTAFNITILDTISPYLDLATLEMGASSHHYTWSIQNGTILKVHFPKVMLPDSNVNEPLSNGFFRYKIEQKSNNSIGTIINNTAAIYFDRNPPVLTNTTWHTVGEDFVRIVLLDQKTVLGENIEVKVYPNPFNQRTTLEVIGKDYDQLELSVFDVTGRLVKSLQSSAQNRIQLTRDGMTEGVYFYELKGNGELVNTGKMVVQ
ncbi:MAG: Internalin-like protein (LPXTG motif) Lmo0331 homolog [uncultured Aureispira sp.]|uniref:Internalin-like protein (LPXTG motif) Lmo0331 homolog n=1 Tax=uncultured Aureispira sp. TaxID=1331704 RepID=A0A6S6THJ5_9BACT|nr:MAG: Internalin-like protein (LPXTG motif) Lmo0331 homolog [uncultured Aureispira sp.]